MNPRLLEIREEIDALLRRVVDLRSEENKIVVSKFHLPGPSLEFDPDGRTIRWGSGSVKLGVKSFRFSSCSLLIEVRADQQDAGYFL